MKLIGFMGIVATLLSAVNVARAGALPLAPQVGDTYEITLTRDSTQQGSDRSSGSSHDKDTIIERVIALRADGVDLQYDLPNDATAEERAGNWQFPVQVFKPFDGPAQLLNAPELETRVDAWLKAAGWSRTACGHWIFTWNAFRIECDPQSVIKALQSFDLRSTDLREGAPYQETDALGSGKLARKSAGPDGAIFTVEMPVDPDPVRRAHAESDVLVGEVMNKPVSLDAALSEWARETVSGTISVTFETDPAGNRRRTKVTKLDIKGPDGRSETETVTETLERRLIAQTAVWHPPAPVASPVERSGSLGNVQRYLWPVLASAGKTARIYYEAICPPTEDYPLAFPRIEVRPSLANATGLAAVRSVFREEKGVLVAEDPPGVIRVRIGRVPDVILRTWISKLSLNPIDQYNSMSAIWAVENAPEVQSAMEKLHIVVPTRVVNMPVVRPAEGLPHLPPELSNVTMDQALDMVARTWGGIVFYGACTEPGTYEILWRGP